MSDFVKTPAGVIMHVDNHRAAVQEARAAGLRGLVAMLEPAEPIDSSLVFHVEVQAKDPSRWLEDLDKRISDKLGKKPPER